MARSHTRNCIESPIKSAGKSQSSWATTWFTMPVLSFHRWFLPFSVFDPGRLIWPHTFYHLKWCCHSIRSVCGVGAWNGSFSWMLDCRMRCAWSLRRIISFFIAIILSQFAFIFNFWSIQFETMSNRFKWQMVENSMAGRFGIGFARNWPSLLPCILNQLSIEFD